ncbi:MAG: hypothetical protein KC503_10100, partial [Myxococcales bacterium]|nr:hypothetical protein [Myxococcales bacterium]
ATAARPQRGGRRHPLADLAGMGDDVGAPPSDIGQPGDVWVFNAGRAPNGVCGPAQVPYNDFILYQRAQALREAYFGPGKVYGSLGRISKKCYHASAYLTEVRKQARLAAIRRRRYGGGYSGRRYGGSYGRRSGRYRSGYGYRRSYGGYGK